MSGPLMRTLVVATSSGALLTAFVADRVPDYGVTPAEPIITRNSDGSGEESFFFGVADGIAVTHAGQVPLGAGPPGVELFTDPALDRGFILVSNVRDRSGSVVGFAVELEVHPREDMLAQNLSWDTEWLLVLPGRGMLILHQQEHSNELGPRVINPTLASGIADEGESFSYHLTIPADTVFATSSLLRGRLMTHTLWSIVEPGRGVLHLYQVENNWRLFKRVLLPALLRGVDFTGSFRSRNTVGPNENYRGRVIGGTGEFAELSGEFVEIGNLQRLTRDGMLAGIWSCASCRLRRNEL